MVQTSFRSSKNAEDTFRFIASGDAMELFEGDTLLPGIDRVLSLGPRIRVKDTWGFENEEQIISASPPRVLVFHIKPNPLLALLVRGLSEEWLVEENDSGSRVVRTFSLAPRLWSGPLLPLIERKLRQAICKNNEKLSFYLLLENQEIRQPLRLPL